MEYVVLRKTKDVERKASREEEPIPPFQKEVVDVPPDRREQISEEDSVLGVIPHFAISLITPVGLPPVASTAKPKREPVSSERGENKSTWGVRAVGADTSRYTGRGVRVAILDTGIATHDAFPENIKFDRKNFTTEEEDLDTDGHGTHCAGTIFGRDVNGLQIGVARGVTDVLVGKVIGNEPQEIDVLIDALLWAYSKRAHIVSMSVGIDFLKTVRKLIEKNGFSDASAVAFTMAAYHNAIKTFDNLSRLLCPETGDAGRHTMIVVAAAGNSSNRTALRPFVAPLIVPASAETFISVSALERHGTDDYEVSYFSNAGALMAAPGVDVLSADKDNPNGLISLDGTSMAAPHVAGVMALWSERQMNSNGGIFDARSVIDEAKRATKEINKSTQKDVMPRLIQSPR